MVFPTRTFHAMQGREAEKQARTTRLRAAPWTASVHSFSAAICSGRSAAIIGAAPTWKGWWGDNPPYHAPTFVLTHHKRPPVEMRGGTSFHFITDGIEAALRHARAAAGGRDIKIGGGAATVRQYVQAGHVDEIHLAVAPVVLGRGEALFTGLDLRALGFRTVEHVPTERATHIVLARGR